MLYGPVQCRATGQKQSHFYAPSFLMARSNGEAGQLACIAPVPPRGTSGPLLCIDRYIVCSLSTFLHYSISKVSDL